MNSFSVDKYPSSSSTELFHNSEVSEMKNNQGRWSRYFVICKPYLAMISLQFGYAGMNILTKFSLNHGMSHYVLVVYRHAFATLSIAPLALILER